MKRYGIERHLVATLKQGEVSSCAIPDSTWASCVRAAGARVLSRVGNEEQRAFLLSESTLIVRAHEIVLITCGEMSQAAFLRALVAHIPCRLEALRYSRVAHPLAMASAGLSSQRDIDALREFGVPVATTLDPRANQVVLSNSIGAVTPEAWVTAVQSEARAMATHFCLSAVDDFVFTPAGYSLNALRGRDYLVFHASVEAPASFLTIEWEGRFPPGAREWILSRFIGTSGATGIDRPLAGL